MIDINGKRIFEFIILEFVILNLSWLLITTVKYNKFVKTVSKNENEVYFLQKEDGYSYSVKKPNYLHYTGNLAVSNFEKGELLIIWPLMSGRYKYGFKLQQNGSTFGAYVDENMELIDKHDVYSIQMIEEHKTELQELFSKANEMWQLK